MHYINDIKFDGSRYHVSFWNIKTKRREHLGAFISLALAKQMRWDAVKEANK